MRKPAGSGRKKGQQNKQTIAVKEAIEKTFSNLGGIAALTKWARDNPDTFYASIWPKLLPVQVKHGGDADNDEPIKIGRIELVGPS